MKKARQVKSVPWGQRVPWAPPDLAERWGRKVRRAPWGHAGYKALKVQWVHWDPKVHGG